MAITYDTLFQSDASGDSGSLVDAETALQNLLTNLPDNPSETEILRVQQQIQKWSLLVDFAATLRKMLTDTAKSIIQKM